MLAGVGLGISDILKNGAEKTTHNLFAGSSGAPLLVDVAQPGTFFSGHIFAPYYVIPRSRVPNPGEVGNAAVAHTTVTNEVLNYSWVVAHGGMAGSPQVVRLELRGRSADPVIINAIVPIVVSRAPPVKGWYVAAPACGAEQVRVATFNLDGPRAAVGYVDLAGAQQRILALRVTPTDPELIELWASTRTGTVEWKARLFYSAEGVDKSMVIDDHGRPFIVTTETVSDGYERGPGDASGGLSLQRKHKWDKVGIPGC